MLRELRFSITSGIYVKQIAAVLLSVDLMSAMTVALASVMVKGIARSAIRIISNQNPFRLLRSLSLRSVNLACSHHPDSYRAIRSADLHCFGINGEVSQVPYACLPRAGLLIVCLTCLCQTGALNRLRRFIPTQTNRCSASCATLGEQNWIPLSE